MTHGNRRQHWCTDGRGQFGAFAQAPSATTNRYRDDRPDDRPDEQADRSGEDHLEVQRTLRHLCRRYLPCLDLAEGALLPADVIYVALGDGISGTLRLRACLARGADGNDFRGHAVGLDMCTKSV